MTGVRTFKLDSITADDVVRSKAGRTVSLCIPCRNEATTIGSLVSIVRSELMTRTSVVDELIVLDDRSVDDTARIASQAGARVVSIEDVHRIYGTGHGKGNALWATLLVSHGDVVVWCDGDITSFHPDWVLKLVSPLLGDDSVALIKALYHRPTHHGGGGRTTELVARPLLSLYYPSLSGLAQPLSGEFAARRSVIEQLKFVEGWGVEIAMLIDIASRFSPESIGQVDLGSRLHRHRDLTSLSIQAAEVIATLLDRAGAGPGEGGDAAFLHRSDGSREPLNLRERPSLVDLGLGMGTSTADHR